MKSFSDLDYFSYSQWFHDRHMTPPERTALPKTGVIVPNIAAGFLIKTDCRIGLLDFFCSNPFKEKEERLRALNDIAHILIVSAKNAGMRSIICNTRYSNIKQIALNQGFDYLGEYSTYSKEL